MPPTQDKKANLDAVTPTTSTPKKGNRNVDDSERKSAIGRKNTAMLPPTANSKRRATLLPQASKKEILDITNADNQSAHGIHLNVENTYKMKPDDGCIFKVSQVEAKVLALLKLRLDGVKYGKEAALITRDLTMDIKKAVKDLNFPRYKLICQVTLGQLQDQGVQTVSRCLWDTSTDRFASVTYKNESIFATATVHGVYLD